MNYAVSEKHGETLRIGLREVGEGHYEIQIEGRTIQVDAARSGPTVYSIIEDGRQFEVMLDEKGAHGFDVLVSGRLFHLESQDERSQLLAASTAGGSSGPQRVEAEMAGKVVKVAAAVGESVGSGQGVVVVEAMKMENEISSPIEGEISEIGVAEGQTVEPGDLLFVVTPSAVSEDASS